MHGSYINGQWLTEGNSFEVTSPVTGDTHAQIHACSRSDVALAIESAQAAFPAWAALAQEERAAYMLKVAEQIELLGAEIAENLMYEVGSWIGKAKGEAGSAGGMFRAAAEIAQQVTGYDLVSPTGRKSFVVREPLGVVSVITPWNVPFGLSSRTTSGILAVGNTVVLKPSELSPISGGILLAKAVDQAGVPPGVFNVVCSSRAGVMEVGDEMVSHKGVKALSFTGSTQVGKALAGKASQHLKKVSMELGGKDAMIVMSDADIDGAVNAAVFSSFNHSGQICMGTKRIFVDDKIADEFVNKFVTQTQGLGVGDVTDMAKPIAPLINDTQVQKLQEQVEDAKAKGATVLTGGGYQGLFFEPTVLTDVNESMKTWSEESFGPLVSVYRFKDVNSAISMLNDCEYGLSASVITQDTEKGVEVAKQIESGMCHINDGTVYAEPLAPFGGAKNSGVGRYGGLASVESFTTTRWVTVSDKTPDYPPVFMGK
ncbi:MAG: aldehyde dehydrogenase family protein [Pseudomonadota bacterium]